MHRQPWVPSAVQQQASPAYIELAEQSGGARMVETKVDLASKLMRTTSVSCTGEPQVRKLMVCQVNSNLLSAETCRGGSEGR